MATMRSAGTGLLIARRPVCSKDATWSGVNIALLLLSVAGAAMRPAG
jgi:hypothetical protein